jgi:hypothetical protein
LQKERHVAMQKYLKKREKNKKYEKNGQVSKRKREK